MKHLKLYGTITPNIIYDYWGTRTTNAEFKILMMICRKTYGWRKTSDHISLKQLMKMSSISRPGVCKCLALLVEKGLVIKKRFKTPEGDDAPSEFTINCELEIDDYMEEEECNSVGGGGKLSLLPVVNSVNPQKKDLTKERKENIKRKKSIEAEPPKKKLKKPKEELVAYGEYVRFTEGHYEELVKQDGKERVDRLIKAMNIYMPNRPQGPYKDYQAGYQTFKMNDKYNNSNSSGEGLDKNKAYAAKVAKEFNEGRGKQRRCVMECLSKNIQIYSPVAQHGEMTRIGYHEHGFTDQLDSAIRKWSGL